MSKEQKEVKKKKSIKWTFVQALGLWFVITALVSFWSGVYLGQLQVNETHDKIKAEAAALVELKTEQ